MAISTGDISSDAMSDLQVVTEPIIEPSTRYT